MKGKKSSFKFITIALTIVLSLQSCKAYQNKTVTLEDAVLVNQKVKVKTFNNDTYEFESLQKESGKLIGIATRKSDAAKKLKDLIIMDNPSNKFVKIDLSDNLVKEIHLQRKGKALRIIGGTGLGILAGIGALLLYFILAQ